MAGGRTGSVRTTNSRKRDYLTVQLIGWLNYCVPVILHVQDYLEWWYPMIKYLDKIFYHWIMDYFWTLAILCWIKIETLARVFLFTDEATFSRRGITDVYNDHCMQLNSTFTRIQVKLPDLLENSPLSLRIEWYILVNLLISA